MNTPAKDRKINLMVYIGIRIYEGRFTGIGVLVCVCVRERHESQQKCPPPLVLPAPLIVVLSYKGEEMLLDAVDQ